RVCAVGRDGPWAWMWSPQEKIVARHRISGLRTQLLSINAWHTCPLCNRHRQLLEALSIGDGNRHESRQLVKCVQALLRKGSSCDALQKPQHCSQSAAIEQG